MVDRAGTMSGDYSRRFGATNPLRMNPMTLLKLWGSDGFYNLC